MKENKFISITFLFSIFITMFFVFAFFIHKVSFNSSLKFNGIDEVVSLIEKIDNDCKIIEFPKSSNVVDFLNLKKIDSNNDFIKILYPDRWCGNYCTINPSLQNILYKIINTKNGCYVVPGDGVVLNNRIIVGKDVNFDFNSDIDHLIESGILKLSNRSVAKKIEFSGNYWQLSMQHSVLRAQAKSKNNNPWARVVFS